MKSFKEVPSFSQYLDVHDDGWKDSANGVVSLAMVMNFHNPKITKEVINKMIADGLRQRCYDVNCGWDCGRILRLAENFGFSGVCFDFSQLNGGAIKSMSLVLSITPVITAVYRDFNPVNKTNVVVVKAITDKKRTVLINNPEAWHRAEVPQKVSLDVFYGGWKKKILAVVPKRNKHLLPLGF